MFNEPVTADAVLLFLIQTALIIFPIGAAIYFIIKGLIEKNNSNNPKR